MQCKPGEVKREECSTHDPLFLSALLSAFCKESVVPYPHTSQENKCTLTSWPVFFSFLSGTEWPELCSGHYLNQPQSSSNHTCLVLSRKTEVHSQAPCPRAEGAVDLSVNFVPSSKPLGSFWVFALVQTSVGLQL